MPGPTPTRSRRSAQTRERIATWPPRQTYRKLTSLGLSPEEAANLTAFMCGIPVEGAHWSLRQVNQLLFLRELQRTGRFGQLDGRVQRPA